MKDESGEESSGRHFFSGAAACLAHSPPWTCGAGCASDFFLRSLQPAPEPPASASPLFPPCLLASTLPPRAPGGQSARHAVGFFHSRACARAACVRAHGEASCSRPQNKGLKSRSCVFTADVVLADDRQAAWASAAG